MALPAAIADRAFLSLLGHIGNTGDHDPRSLTRWLQDEYLSRMGDNPTYYNYQEYAAVVRAALAATEAANLYTQDPNSRPAAGDIPRISTIGPDHSRYQYRLRVEIDTNSRTIDTAVTIYSDTVLSSEEIYERALRDVQETQSGRDSIVGAGGADAIVAYHVIVLSVGQQR